MAERNSFSRPTSGKSKRSVKDTNVKASKDRDLESKTKDYMKMNEELEARTASLFEYVDSVKREQESTLDAATASSSLLDRVNMDDYMKDWDISEDNTALSRDLESPVESSRVDPYMDSARGDSVPVDSARVDSSRPGSKVSNISRPSSKTKKTAKTLSKKKPSSAAGDTTSDLTLQSALANIEDKIEKGETLDYVDDVIPAEATELGAESQMRFMRAKLRVMQEELDKLAADYTKKEEENAGLMIKLKEAEEERNRLGRTNAAQQSQMEKYRKLADDAKVKADSLETQLSVTQKELDQLKRSQKKQESSQSATEVRLNRALEEIEKLKSQLQKAKSEVKESSAGEKKRVDQLLAENKRLEKQKGELLAGFKKQLKLIDVLKRQRMHIEAAKMLQFSEEEFVKALEWGN